MNFGNGIRCWYRVCVAFDQVDTETIFARGVGATGHDDGVDAGRARCTSLDRALCHQLFDLPTHFSQHDGVDTARQGYVKFRLVLENDAVDTKLARIWPWRPEIVRVAVEHTHARSEGFVRYWFAETRHEAGSLAIHVGEELPDAVVLHLRRG